MSVWSCGLGVSGTGIDFAGTSRGANASSAWPGVVRPASMARTSAILVDVFMFRFPSLFPSTGRLAPLVVKLPDETNGWPDAGLLLPDIERLSPHRAVGGGNQSAPARTKVTLDKRVSGAETVGLLLNCSGPATDHWRVRC
jgi:hypothetical protein